MKTGKLFWGTLLTALGLLFLGVKFHILSTDWCFLWNLWPLIFILWGLMVLFKHPVVKPIIASLFGLLMALFIFGSIQCVFGGFYFGFDDDVDYQTYNDNFNVDFDSGVKQGHLTFSSGAGAFSIKGTTDRLLEGEARGWFSNYVCDSNIDDDVAYVDVYLHENNIKFFGKKLKNRLNMRLNPNIEWDMHLDFGAASAKFDLSPYIVREIKIGTGAASVDLKLGDRADNTDLTIDMGAATLNLQLPQNVGCKVDGDTFLVSKDMPGFRKRGDDLYYSSNYDTAEKKVNVRINSGVSTFSVRYY